MEAVLARTSGVRQNLQSSFDAAADVEKLKQDLDYEKLLHRQLKGSRPQGNNVVDTV